MISLVDVNKLAGITRREGSSQNLPAGPVFMSFMMSRSGDILGI